MGAEPLRGGVDRKKVGIVTMVAGAAFILGALLSQIADPLWILILAGWALLLYAIPKLHEFQAPADGAAGEWGSRLVLFGAALLVLLGIIYLVWEVVGTPPEDGGVVNVLWIVGFFAFVIGIIAFTIGTLLAKVFPQAAPILMLVGLVGGVAVDMASGTFFEEDGGTQWGLIIGVPLFGAGLAWIGYSLWQEITATTSPPVESS